MNTRTRNAIALSVIGAFFVGGMVALTRPKAVANSRAASAIPKGAMLLATADLAPLRASALGAQFLREGREIQGVGKIRDVCGFDPLETLAEVALGIPTAGDSGEFGVAAAGPLNDTALIACASKVIEARGGHPVVTKVGTFRLVRDEKQATSYGAIAVRRGGLLLLGEGPYLQAMMDAAEHRAPSIDADPAHKSLAQALGDPSLRVTFVPSPEQRKSFADELARSGGAGSHAAGMTAAALGIHLGPTVRVHVLLTCETPEDCSALGATADRMREAFASNVGARLIGAQSLLEHLVIRPEGATVHARAEVPASDAATLVERVSVLRARAR